MAVGLRSVGFRFGKAVVVSRCKLCSGMAGRSGEVEVRFGGFGEFGYVRQGPSGSVELRRVGARRLRLVMFCWVEVSFGRAVELGQGPLISGVVWRLRCVNSS